MGGITFQPSSIWSWVKEIIIQKRSKKDSPWKLQKIWKDRKSLEQLSLNFLCIIGSAIKKIFLGRWEMFKWVKLKKRLLGETLNINLFGIIWIKSVQVCTDG